MSVRLPLDPEDRIAVERTPRGFVLRRPAGDVHSRLHRAFRTQVVVEADGARHPFGDDDACVVSAGTPARVLLRETGVVLGRWDGGAFERVSAPLTPFETRALAENGHPHPGHAHPVDGLQPITDLHSHFNGCPRPADLLAHGLAHDVVFPGPLLKLAGIEVSAAKVPLASLSEELRQRIASRLSLPCDRQSTFQELEAAYALRGPLVRTPEAFAALLPVVARDYAAMGIRYVELSHGSMEQAAFLRRAEALIDPVEAETGVRVRFLLGIRRHNDPEWNADLLDRLKALAGSRALAGIDVMGHETNSTRDFEGLLRGVAEWADTHRPGFVVRVHAGENPAFPENVRAAIDAVEGKAVRLRIGHGLYGTDDRTLERLAKVGAIVEFNPNSNLALNNIRSGAGLPIVRTLSAGVCGVLGTDGYGMYATSPAAEVRAASLAGLTTVLAARITETEHEHLAAQERAETLLPRGFDVPDDTPPRHWGPHVEARRKQERAERDRILREQTEAIGAKWLDDAGVEALLGGKRLVSIAGAWKVAWAALPESDRTRIRDVLAELVHGLPADRVVLATGGTVHGVEGVVHGFAKMKGIPVLATLVLATPPEALDPAVTHAWPVSETPHGKAARLYDLVRRHDGLALFFAGGNVVNDEIRAASNLRLRHLLLADVGGASGDHALEAAHRAFRTASEALARLDDDAWFAAAYEPYWHLGPNPTVDVAAFRTAPGEGGREVLLIRRHDDAPTEPGRWALPGGFVHTEAPRGEPWTPGAEPIEDAALRELAEESGLALSNVRNSLRFVDVFEGGGRDLRDTPSSWSRTHLFTIDLPDTLSGAAIAGGDDAAEARWWPLSALPPRLAFDHARLVVAARAHLDSLSNA